ncbi:unnamed protein product [Cuscuta campestris]|uniref:RNase H type-1 domain-containing protein n=1 Tax=Cuscuta campestris TaxID=132261 RepID=A0A484KHG2_9ASTE|nr:unnamed protein product [Cuscuta campestris]
MPGIDRSVICHRLSVLEGSRPVRQKKRFLASDRRDFVKKEVKDLLEEEEPARTITEPWWSMSVDGAAGPKGYGGGVVFTTPEGFKVYHALIFNFKLTNNEAEYEALIGGLRLAKTLQITCLRIKSDSSLVVGHINGNMEAKGEKMQKYRDLARALLKDLTEYVMEKIPRGENTDADLLSKLTQAAPEHVFKLARIETLEKASIERLSVSLIEEDGQPNLTLVEPDDIWLDDLVKYYMTGQFPEDEDRLLALLMDRATPGTCGPIHSRRVRERRPVGVEDLDIIVVILNDGGHPVEVHVCQKEQSDRLDFTPYQNESGIKRSREINQPG